MSKDVREILFNDMKLVQISKDEISKEILWFCVYDRYYKVDFSKALSSLAKLIRREKKEVKEHNGTRKQHCDGCEDNGWNSAVAHIASLFEKEG